MKETLKKQRLFFISIIGIVVVSLVMGTTFAYQTISMNETETRKVVLEAGVLDVSFKTTNLIETSNMPLLPAYSYADYTEFTVDNTKSSADAAFKIGLADIEYGYVNDSGTKVSGCRTETTVQAACIVDENFKYTVVEVVDEEETLVKEGNFANLASTEADLTNFITITKGTTKTYRFYLWLNETEDNQNHLEKTYFKGKINITSMFSNEITLKNVVMSDARITKNEGTPTFTGVETNEVGMYSAQDDYGTSWYFRGAQSYNYVNFAGFTWRIVRINGDGSIRLILDGTLDKVYRQNEDGTVSTTAAGTTGVFNSSYKDNAYVGYMYGTAGSTDYDTTHKNIKDSKIKDNIDLFYETYIENDANNYHYEKYLSDTLFCGDKTLASTTIGDSNTRLGYGTNITYYAVTERLFYSSGTTNITTATPKLECASGATNTYSRYTANSTETSKGVNVNNDLNYPIALLSADELVMAGAFKGEENQSYYLSDAYGYETPTMNIFWWTMTPGYFDGSDAYEFLGNATNYSLFIYNLGVNGFNRGTRPVINLKADNLIKGGDGTYESPYTLQEIS